MALAETYFCQVSQPYVGHTSYSKRLLPEYANAFLMILKLCYFAGLGALGGELQPNAASSGKAGTGAPGCLGFRTGTAGGLADPDCREKNHYGAELPHLSGGRLPGGSLLQRRRNGEESRKGCWERRYPVSGGPQSADLTREAASPAYRAAHVIWGRDHVRVRRSRSYGGLG